MTLGYNDLQESALEAFNKDFKRARKTSELISYAKFAFNISHETAEPAYEKAIKSARSSNDFLQLDTLSTDASFSSVDMTVSCTFYNHFSALGIYCDGMSESCVYLSN